MERAYWSGRLREATIARNIAEQRVAIAPIAGQIALFEDPKPPALALRRGEVRNQYDDFAHSTGGIAYPDFGRSEPPDVAA